MVRGFGHFQGYPERSAELARKEQSSWQSALRIPVDDLWILSSFEHKSEVLGGEREIERERGRGHGRGERTKKWRRRYCSGDPSRRETAYRGWRSLGEVR